MEYLWRIGSPFLLLKAWLHLDFYQEDLPYCLLKVATICLPVSSHVFSSPMLFQSGDLTLNPLLKKKKKQF